jgi:protein-disulfide isomerase
MRRDFRSLTLLLFSLFLVALFAPAQEMPQVRAQDGSPVKGKQVIAILGGQGVLADELLPLVRPQLRQLRRQEYEIESKAIESLINEKLIEAEAKKKGVPKEKFFEQEIESKVADPTHAEVEAYYLGQRSNRPFEEVKDQLRAQLKQAKIQLVREKYIHDLREKAQVTVLLRPPKAQVSFDSARLRGDPKAPITIVEFSDFQCPYCRKAEPAVKELLAKHPEVRFAYRDFPLRDIHPQAQAAAEAARCAQEQGKFWEFHDALFASEKLDHDAYLEMARSVGLDQKQFEGCVASGKYKDPIEKDLQDGTQAGVNGTPGFFVNGIALSGNQPVSAFEKIIADEMAASERSTASATQKNP